MQKEIKHLAINREGKVCNKTVMVLTERYLEIQCCHRKCRQKVRIPYGRLFDDIAEVIRPEQRYLPTVGKRMLEDD